MSVLRTWGAVLLALAGLALAVLALWLAVPAFGALVLALVLLKAAAEVAP